jgi:hypothetical protein
MRRLAENPECKLRLANLSSLLIDLLTHPLQGSRPPEGPIKEAEGAGHVASPERPDFQFLEKVYLHWVSKDRAMLGWFLQQLSDFNDVGLSGADVSTTLSFQFFLLFPSFF